MFNPEVILTEILPECAATIDNNLDIDDGDISLISMDMEFVCNEEMQTQIRSTEDALILEPELTRAEMVFIQRSCYFSYQGEDFHVYLFFDKQDQELLAWCGNQE